MEGQKDTLPQPNEGLPKRDLEYCTRSRVILIQIHTKFGKDSWRLFIENIYKYRVLPYATTKHIWKYPHLAVSQ